MEFEEYFKEWLKKSHWLRLGVKGSGGTVKGIV